MSKVKIQGHTSGTGILTIAAPNTNTDRTVTIPDSSGTLLNEGSTLDATKLSGVLPALDGSALTGLTAGASDINGLSDGTTSGTNNTGLGSTALDSWTTGTQNTAVGANALTAITTGNTNTAVGSNALSSCTDSNDNVAIGYVALAANVTGAYNTAVGTQTLENCTSNYNTAVGYQSLRTNTTGSYNTAVGHSSLNAVNSGSGNTSIGKWSLLNVGTGSQNVGVGESAGQEVQGGSNNICVGYKAGINISSGSSNIVIGNNITAPSAGASNQLNIGDWIKKTSSSNDISLVGGVQFNGDTAAANALDDYEEGYVSTGIANCVLDTSYNKLRYIKIGNLCTVTGQIRITSNGGGTYAVSFSLPFAAEGNGTNNRPYAAAAMQPVGMVLDASSIDFSALVSPGSTTCDVRKHISSAASVPFQVNQINTSAFQMTVTLTYVTA